MQKQASLDTRRTLSYVTIDEVIQCDRILTLFKDICVQDFNIENVLFLEEVFLYKTAKKYRKPDLAMIIYSKFFDKKSIYELNVCSDVVEKLRCDIVDKEKINNDLFSEVTKEVKRNIMPSYKKFIKSEAFEIAYLINKRKSSPDTFNSEPKNNSFTFSSQEISSVDHYEKQHIKKLEKLNEILTEKLQNRKKCHSSPVLSKSSPNSRTSGVSSRRASRDSQAEVFEFSKFQEFSFGEINEDEKVDPIKEEVEMNLFKYPNSPMNQNHKKRSTVHIFFNDIKKKLNPNKQQGKINLKKIETNDGNLSFQNIRN
eukprot:gene883-9794_t